MLQDLRSKRRGQKAPLRAHKGRRVQGCKTVKTKVATTKKLHARIFELEVSVFKRLCKAVNTPFALSMLTKVDAGDWLGIAQTPTPSPLSDTFADDYLIQQVMRKNPRLPIKVDREASAISKWHEVESKCAKTNDLIRLASSDTYTERRASLAIKPSVVASIRRTIAEVLGPLTEVVLDGLTSKTRFGPGATFHCSSKNLTAAKKNESAIGLTPSLRCFLGSIEPAGWLATTSGYRLTDGNKATTVPKDALIDRFIAIEPALNMRWQLAIGAVIRHRLKRLGLDLRHQADKNRLRVRFAQITGLATIDLESASDSVARLLVGFLFPPRWAHLLTLFRSEYTLVGQDWVRTEKFSSMGNGFTFELETLLFYAVCKAFDSDPFVFGDDMIVTQTSAPDVIRTLNILGFSVNEKKTFLAGSFFESCGSDYWHGRNVRPFFFKKDEYHDFTSAVIRMANAVRRYAHRRNHGYGCDSRFLPTWLYLLSRCQDARRTSIPDGYGDVGIVRDFDDATPTKLRHGHCGFIAKTWTARPIKTDVTFSLAGYYSSLDTQETVPKEGVKPFLNRHPIYGHPCAPQYGNQTPRLQPLESDGQREWYTQGEQSSQTHQSVRGRMGKSKHRGMPVQHWHELGPWL